MTDPISVANLALSLIKTAGEQLNKLRERAQATKDLEIKEHVGNLYDTMNGVKEVISRLLDENKDLKRQLDAQQHPPEKPTLRQVGEANYYYKGEEGPFCQPCYDDKGKYVALSPPKQTQGGDTIRMCLVCNHSFFETRVQHSPAYRRFGGGPQGWMG